MKKTPQFIGFLQALGVVAYCTSLALLFWGLDNRFQGLPQFFAMALMLVLLVFSAAVTGSMVFGYAAHLALKARIREAMAVVAYTLLFGFGFFLLVLIGLAFFA